MDALDLADLACLVGGEGRRLARAKRATTMMSETAPFSVVATQILLGEFPESIGN